MVVVADTSPINYLVLIGHLEILPRLYSRILIPPAVLAELEHPMAPQRVRDWAAHLPSWLEVRTAEQKIHDLRLDSGEREALALAAEMQVDVVLIDELQGREAAGRRGLRVAGTLAVLDEAAQAGFADFDQAVGLLRQTSFRVSDDVLAEVRQRRDR